MTERLSSEEIEHLARKRAGAKLGFFFHLALFVLVNLLLFAMSELAFGHRRWSVYPLIGWGFGVALHGVSVFMLGSGSGLRQRMVERERERLQREQDRIGRP